MQTEIAASDRADASTADERWAAWVARGVEHDRKTRKRALAAAAVIASGMGVWLAFGLLLR
jgi:DnaJ-domain-containing protein 1